MKLVILNTFLASALLSAEPVELKNCGNKPGSFNKETCAVEVLETLKVQGINSYTLKAIENTEKNLASNGYALNDRKLYRETDVKTELFEIDRRYVEVSEENRVQIGTFNLYPGNYVLKSEFTKTEVGVFGPTLRTVVLLVSLDSQVLRNEHSSSKHSFTPLSLKITELYSGGPRGDSSGVGGNR